MNSIQVLADMADREYISKLVKYSLNILEQHPDLLSVTREKFDIMNLAEGELYDKSLIESTIKQLQDASAQANLKKESKAYSYKEQLAELELRKELEKAKGGKKKEETTFTLAEIRAKMSKKQQEQLDAQVLKEKTIRDEMKKLEAIIKKSTQILIRLIEGNFYDSKDCFAQMFTALTSYVRSPLCVSYVHSVFETAATNLARMNSNSTNYLYSINFLRSTIVCFIRLSKVKNNLENNWLDEDLDTNCNRLNKILRNELEADIKDELFDISLSSLFYPLFKVIKDSKSLRHYNVLYTFSI